jgi:hypothetical protein
MDYMKILGRSFRYGGFAIAAMSIVMLLIGWLNSAIRSNDTLISAWWSIPVENTVGILSAAGFFTGAILWIIGQCIHSD